jgi:hypothetical protein
MNLGVTALCSLALGCAGGPTVTVYHRTSPRRVEVEKVPSPSSLFALAIRRNPDRVDVHLKQESRVTLRRVLQYNAEALVYGPSGNVLFEILELFTGLLVLIDPGLWGFEAQLDGHDTATRKLVRHRSAILALLDPTTSAVANNVREVPLVTEPIFSDPPVVREYQIRVPAPGLTVAFRVMDEARRVLAEGTRTADAYGELQITGPLVRGVAVELKVAAVRATIVVPIQQSRAPAMSDYEPDIRSPSVVRPPLANEGWERWRDDTDRLPRVSLMIDAAGLAARELILFGELRFRRRWSVAGSLARESFAREREPPTRATLIHNLGGELRLYPFGHMGTGFHLGLEAATGFSNLPARRGTLDVALAGVTLGYKHTFDLGFTVDFCLNERFVKLDDSTTRGAGGWSLWPRGDVNLGWSF